MKKDNKNVSKRCKEKDSKLAENYTIEDILRSMKDESRSIK